MKKKLLSVCLGALVTIGLLIASISVLAAPSAGPSMTLAGVTVDGSDLIVNVDIAIGSPSEPYASLDFNLVSSSSASLTLESVTYPNLPGISGAANLTGTAEGNGHRWLIGIASTGGAGNLITGAVDICTVRLRYSGSASQTLSLRDMKLIYIDGEGKVTSVGVNTEAVKLTIDRSLAPPSTTMVPTATTKTTTTTTTQPTTTTTATRTTTTTTTATTRTTSTTPGAATATASTLITPTTPILSTPTQTASTAIQGTTATTTAVTTLPGITSINDPATHTTVITTPVTATPTTPPTISNGPTLLSQTHEGNNGGGFWWWIVAALALAVLAAVTVLWVRQEKKR